MGAVASLRVTMVVMEGEQGECLVEVSGMGGWAILEEVVLDHWYVKVVLKTHGAECRVLLEVGV